MEQDNNNSNEGNQQKEAQPVENSFLKDSNNSNISLNEPKQYSKAEMNRINVFKHIEKTQPTNIYKVAKELSLAYNTCSYIIRDLIFAGVVSERMKFNKNNQAIKELTIPMEEKK